MTTKFESGPLTGLSKPSAPLGESPSSIWGRLVSTSQSGGLDLSKQALAARFNRSAPKAEAASPMVSVPSLSGLLGATSPAAPTPTASPSKAFD